MPSIKTNSHNDNLASDNDIVLTFDADWAPDHVISSIAEKLIEAEVPSTWFITHVGPWVERLRAYPDLFELGIHPNFFSCSTHGDTISEVLCHCMDLVPEARCMRTHGLLQSTRLFDQVIEETPIDVDVSLLMHRSSTASPYWHYGTAGQLLRMPFTWEDDIEARQHDPNWKVIPERPVSGAHILNFHPILVALNDGDGSAYAEVKSRCANLRNASFPLIQQNRQKGVGPAVLFELLLRHAEKSGCGKRILDIVHEVEARI